MLLPMRFDAYSWPSGSQTLYSPHLQGEKEPCTCKTQTGSRQCDLPVKNSINFPCASGQDHNVVCMVDLCSVASYRA
jgi:hypothetical protein